MILQHRLEKARWIGKIFPRIRFDLAGDLFDMNEWKLDQFSLLSSEQRRAIGDYLRFIQDQEGYWLEVHKIDFALESFWDTDPAPATATTSDGATGLDDPA